MGLCFVPGTHPWLSHECPGYSTGVIRVLGHFDTRLSYSTHPHSTLHFNTSSTQTTGTGWENTDHSSDGFFCSQRTNLSWSDKNVYHLHDITTHSTHIFRISQALQLHNVFTTDSFIFPEMFLLFLADGWQLQIPRATRSKILCGWHCFDLQLSQFATVRWRSHAVFSRQQEVYDPVASQTICIYGWMC